jgi:uncharacterized protein (TIGR02679 family)
VDDDALDPRLTRLLGDPEVAWLVARVRRRLEHGQSLEGAVTLTNATAAQRHAVGRLLGRAPRPGRALNVSLPAVDAVLRGSGACPAGLAQAVVLLGGAVPVRADETRREAALWEAAYDPLRQAVDEHGGHAVRAWLEALGASGAVKRLERDPAAAAPLLRQAADVLRALPAEAEPLGRFATRVAGGAHALDEGRPLATIVLGMVRAIGGVAPAGPDESRSEARREAWATVGVLLDELSSTVLSVGLPGEESSVGGRVLAAGAGAGEPVVLTLRQLVQDAPRWSGAVQGLDVRICENPVVVAAAADALGPACPPLVCTGGQPSAAVMVLLRSLAGAGARLSHHGDFDWGGVRIGNVLCARLPQIVPWRFVAADYEAAASGASGLELTGAPAEATWDVALGPAMRRLGRAVEEEAVLDLLLDDLLSSGPRG